ncbi:MAG: hypothetical protein E7574_01275 [Ruminococcaceae bacterium]|nr:hypothetical protein [Oscillospiraceae bacterium]
MTKVKSQPVFYVLYLLVVYLFFFLIKTPVLATESITRALRLCYTKVIPSLFPFLVLSELIVSSHIAEHFGNLFGKPLSKLFKIQKISATAFIMGCLFGFPLGTKIAVSLYENNYISKEETERLICFCSNTGPAFVIGITASVLNNTRLAVCIYVCQVISAFIIGIFLRKDSPVIIKNNTELSGFFSPSCIPNSITSSVLPMLNICSFVCFFSCISASIENMLVALNFNGYLQNLITGFLEITNGIANLQYSPLNVSTVFLAAFFVGWSGVSVILQSINITSKQSLSCKKYIVSKLFQGIICACLTLVLCKLLKIF